MYREKKQKNNIISDYGSIYIVKKMGSSNESLKHKENNPNDIKKQFENKPNFNPLKIDLFVENINKNIKTINKNNNNSNNVEDINNYLYKLTKTNIKHIDKIDQ